MRVIEIGKTNWFTSKKSIFLESTKFEIFELNGITHYILPYTMYRIKVSDSFPVSEKDIIEFKSICLDSAIPNNFHSYAGPTEFVIETLIQEGKIERSDVSFKLLNLI